MALGMDVAAVRQRLQRVRARTGLALPGYNEIDDAQLAEMTGLDLASASRARQRDYSETLIARLPAETWQALDEEFAREGLECRHGGRFHTVTGAGTDKGRAVRAISDLYREAYGRDVHSLGLGDSANDLPLLAAVDRPFLVAREDGSWADFELEGLERAQGRGPFGWIEVTNHLLAEAHTEGVSVA